jgi:hypothetical protein
MTTFREKRRARRVASDEAHAWARSLQLHNPHAKTVLRALALYVDGEACCFVGLDQLALDTDLSADTVRRRLVWLEEIGVIARVSQWLDSNGRRNGEGRGKRTSDLIRLLLDADEDAIEAQALGEAIPESAGISTAISPSRQLGLNSGQPSVSPPLALAVLPGSDSLNHEPESPPLPPSGGRESEAVASGQESEPEDFAPAWQAYPGREVMRRDLALAEFRLLPKDQQGLCRMAVPLYAQALARHGRTKPPSMHLWIRTGGFEEFRNAAKAAEDRPQQVATRTIEGDELAGLRVAVRIAEQRELLIDKPIRSRKPDVQHDLAALAQWAADFKRDGWHVVELGSPRFAAWRDRLRFWCGGIEPKTERIWLEPYDPAIHDLPRLHPDFRLRRSAEGYRVPRPFPPRRDGTWSTEDGEAA